MSHDPGPITDPDAHVDPWFKHAASEPHHQESHGEFSAKGVYATIAFIIIVTFGVAIIVVPWVSMQVRGIQAVSHEQSSAISGPRQEAFSTWDAELHGNPDWIDQQTGVVSVPIEEAKRRVIARYSDGS